MFTLWIRDFINYSTDYICVLEHKKNTFGGICTSSQIKKESFILVMKTNLGALQFYILVLMLTFEFEF